ncbi:TPA: hypothetical protein U1366_002249 [Streptococcus suis]|nr:hypothetical protein [Streptococcus suis]
MFENISIGINPSKKTYKIKFQDNIFNSEVYKSPSQINLKDTKVEVVFLDSAKVFKNIASLKFTNKRANIGDEDPQTILCLTKFLSNVNVIKSNSKSITIGANAQGNRMKQILYEFLDSSFVDSHDYCFRKSAIQEDFDVTNIHNGRFRVICLFRIKPPEHKKEKIKYFLEVVLLDPYHLFIPSQLKIQNSNSGKIDILDRNQVMNTVYERVKDYNRDFDITADF